ncbi:hypothetical protein HNR48_002983 [Pseudoteredinibacter isoporae]|uniref:Uncharacterized protein n=1 Tax=Pseudoteredinibacter isoporae TaxID=570281 RepID=A0A7X0JVX1_9GAMM|nr:hypothetical protein [Pseudoteredinibacter isoporae]
MLSNQTLVRRMNLVEMSDNGVFLENCAARIPLQGGGILPGASV